MEDYIFSEDGSKIFITYNSPDGKFCSFSPDHSFIDSITLISHIIKICSKEFSVVQRLIHAGPLQMGDSGDLKLTVMILESYPLLIRGPKEPCKVCSDN